MNYYQGSKDHPQHISVGAVMRNGEGKVMAHYFPPELSFGFWNSQDVSNFYLLMRETMEPGERLEDTLHRGLKEEFNAIARLDDYLGSIVSTAYDGDVPFQKTTLYFLCTYEGEAGVDRDMGDKEGQSTLAWHDAEELIPKMKEQAERFGRTDVDESPILERYLAHRNTSSP